MSRPPVPNPKQRVTIFLRQSIIERATKAAAMRGLSLGQHLSQRIEAAYEDD